MLSGLCTDVFATAMHFCDLDGTRWTLRTFPNSREGTDRIRRQVRGRRVEYDSRRGLMWVDGAAEGEPARLYRVKMIAQLAECWLEETELPSDPPGR